MTEGQTPCRWFLLVYVSDISGDVYVPDVYVDMGRCYLITWIICRVNDSHRNLGGAIVLRAV